MRAACQSCKWTGALFALLPFAWLIGLVALVIRARLFLGYWPRPSRPDPKSLPFELHHMSLWFGLFLLALVFTLAAVFYGANTAFLRRRVNPRPLIAFLGGTSMIVAMIFGPHLNFNWVAWFLD